MVIILGIGPLNGPWVYTVYIPFFFNAPTGELNQPFPVLLFGIDRICEV